MPLYPLTFEPIYKEKVWGGQTLQILGRELPGQTIGESWELADLGNTSASGGGGGDARSVIAQGSLAGKTLSEVIAQFGEKLLGRLPLTPEGQFPLLVKFLDARENLSVQVHPSEAYAQSHPEAHLKSEAWYIVAAEPEGCIYKGVKPGITTNQFRQAIEAGTVVDLMNRIPVRAGDCHYLPSGTCHALGAGVLAAEVQTPSDTTFRVYDWGRTDRELHIEQAMACIDFGAVSNEEYEKRSHVAGIFTTVSRLVQCEHFIIERIRMSEGYEQEIPYDQPAVWMVLQGGGQIVQPNGPTTSFAKGQTLLIPAAMSEASVKLEADTAWLEVTFPQTANTQLA